MYKECTSISTLDATLERLKSKKVHHFEHLNLFEGTQSPNSDSDVWVWGRTSLHNFVKTIGFVYGEKITLYEYTRNKIDVISMRDDSLDWKSHYR